MASQRATKCLYLLNSFQISPRTRSYLTTLQRTSSPPGCGGDTWWPEGSLVVSAGLPQHLSTGSRHFFRSVSFPVCFLPVPLSLRLLTCIQSVSCLGLWKARWYEALRANASQRRWTFRSLEREWHECPKDRARVRNQVHVV